MSTSIFHCISLDIKRGLSNKRLWSVIGIVIAISLLHMILAGIRPLTIYYFGGEKAFDMWAGRVYTGQSEIQNLTGMVLFANFFPFIGAAAYAYTIIDDRRRDYHVQQVQRVGFSRYYWSKMIVSGILGGCLGAFCIGVICLLSTLLITWNPLIKDAVDFYERISRLEQDVYYGHIGWGGNHTYHEVTNPWVWWMLGGVKYFVMGMFFGLLAGMIAFLSDNKVFMYTGPVICTLLYDKWLYVLCCLFRNVPNAAGLLQMFYMRVQMRSFGSLYHYSLLLFLIVLLLNMAKYFQDKVECMYMEGGACR